MILKEFQPEQYETVARWWEAHNWHAVPESFLSKTGLMVYDGEVPRAAIWLYRTDSPVIMAEWLVTNPENTPKQSHVAVKKLLDDVKLIADSQGGYLMTFLQDDSLLKAFEKRGFIVEEKPYTIVHYGGE
ncbi:MAG: hypothetical protein ACYSWO_27270 [Planctomycetota bacterium]|jgi:hypothetical protein